jgi:hypothetical protein
MWRRQSTCDLQLEPLVQIAVLMAKAFSPTLAPCHYKATKPRVSSISLSTNEQCRGDFDFDSTMSLAKLARRCKTALACSGPAEVCLSFVVVSIRQRSCK